MASGSNHMWFLGILLGMCTQLWAESPEPMVPFSFKKKPITELLERFAPPETHLLYPQKAADLEMLKQQYVTYLPHEKETSRASAWNILKTLLELSGFSMFPQKNSFTIVRNASIEGGAINREPLPIFAGTIEDIPQDDGRIIYIHYLKNLKVPEPQEKDTHPLSLMLKQLLTYNASLFYDSKSNGIIIIDTAYHAASVARLLKEFDDTGIKEEVAYLPITYLPAQELVNMVDSLKMAAETDILRTFIRSDPKADAFTYLSQDTRVVSDPQRNGIILMGRKNNIEKIIELIKDLLDVPQDKGDSVLHYYDLKYLESTQVAPILNRIVTASLPSGEQATVESAKPLFPGVVIAALESTIQKPSLATEDIAIEQKGFQEVEKLDYVATNVGNRLLIAARASDWQIIKKLIQQLDTPQPQVLLEVLVVEFAYDNTTNLSGTIRSLTDSPVLPQGVEFLASHITPVVSVLGTTPTQLAVDLLQIIGPGNIPSQIPSGSMLISLNDPTTPGIFGLLEILNKVVSARINSYPYITIKNHKEGLLDSTTMIRTTGDLSTTAGGTATIPIVNLPATFAVNIVPHIVSDSRLRLVIGFTDDRFTDAANLTRRTQELRTTATLNSGEILVMGGLLRVDNLDKGSYTPILGHVPIFGSFFRGTQAQTITTNVTLIVMPTILEPRSRWIAKTNDYICDNKNFVTRTETPAMLRDPIYRLHFRDTGDQQMVDQFIAQGIQRYRCHELKLMQQLPDESSPSYDPLALKQILGRKNLCVPHPPKP